MADLQVEVTEGNGWAAGNIDGMGEGPGFRKVRQQLNVTEMGVNAVVLPPKIGSGTHWHEKQEEVYFVFKGTLRFTLGENKEETVILGPGGAIKVEAPTHRSIANIGDDEATYICFGAQGGYVGRDAGHREDEPRVQQVEA
jgi:mannose-6-phosphate isomerase-like protein (cupin superfamily)